jgi:hypothetical protein
VAVEKPIVVVAPESADTSKQDAINLYRARIPIVAYSTPVIDLGISPRVLSHIERSGLTNIGQIHERLATGDEAMLAIDGIGPKALTEIKQAIEDKGLGLVPLPEPTPVVPVSEVVVVAPVAEAVAPVAVAPVAEAPGEAPVAVTELAATTPEAGTPEAIAAAVKPAGESELAPAIVVSGEAVEEAEDDDEIDRKTGKKKVKRKDRMLVLDESTGVVVAKKQRKAGRGRDLFGLEEEI